MVLRTHQLLTYAPDLKDPETLAQAAAIAERPHNATLEEWALLLDLDADREQRQWDHTNPRQRMRSMPLPDKVARTLVDTLERVELDHARQSRSTERQQRPGRSESVPLPDALTRNPGRHFWNDPRCEATNTHLRMADAAPRARSSDGQPTSRFGQPIQFERYRDTIYLAEKVYHGERDYRVYFDSLEDVLPRNPEDYPDELYFFHAIGNKFDLREGDPHGTHQLQHDLHARLDDLVNYRDTYGADDVEPIRVELTDMADLADEIAHRRGRQYADPRHAGTHARGRMLYRQAYQHYANTLYLLANNVILEPNGLHRYASNAYTMEVLDYMREHLHPSTQNQCDVAERVFENVSLTIARDMPRKAGLQAYDLAARNTKRVLSRTTFHEWF